MLYFYPLQFRQMRPLTLTTHANPCKVICPSQLSPAGIDFTGNIAKKSVIVDSSSNKRFHASFFHKRVLPEIGRN
jgi:hypothetical protein